MTARVRTWIAVLAGLGIAGVLLVGSGLLIVSSVSTPERLKGAVQRKSFGGFDPHLHVALIGAERLEAIETPSGPRQTSGSFWLVTLEMSNDAMGIDFDPSLMVVALDRQGQRHHPLALPSTGDTELETVLHGPLGPGESHYRHFLFELPAGVDDPALWVTYPTWWMRLIPDHENGFRLRKVLFDLDPDRSG